MAFASASAKVWPVTPDWARPVEETLAWATDPLRSSATLASHHRAYRLGPRRGFSFDLLAWEQEHRVIEMLLAGWRGTWLLPIYPDVQWITSPVDAGDVEIECATTGFDFVVGGQALLYRAVNAWEVVEIEAIESDRLELAGPTTSSYGRGCRLYPLRRAMHQDGAEARLLDMETQQRRIAFDIIEPCDWPELASGTEYLGYRVIDERPDESDSPSATWAGQRETVDYGAGPAVVHDLPGIALRAQRDSWELGGRARLSWFRSLLYTLRGRQRPMWVPSWSHDLKPVASIAGGGTSLSIEWAGYTLFGLAKANRRDVRIELQDGQVYHRRITDAVEAGETETLTLSAALDSGSISPGRIRQVSIMALCTLASDQCEITHINGAAGDARAMTGWQAVVPDV